MMRISLLLALSLFLVPLLAGECGIDNCIGCLKGVCTQCEDRYWLTSDKQCAACAYANCLNCNEKSCESCESGYFLHPVKKQCSRCSQLHCLNCQSSGNCKTCMQGYYSKENDQGTNVCYDCGDNCLGCDNGQKCTACETGYFNVEAGDGSFCLSCATNLCETCDVDGNCLTCAGSNFKYTDPETGLVRCYPCGSPNCLVCEDTAGLCTQCKTGYYLNKQSPDQCSSCGTYGCSSCTSPSSCGGCLPGFKYSNGQCVKCPQANCNICDSNICTSCVEGFFLKSEQGELTCDSCAQINCRVCSSNTRCSDCLPSHYLLDNKCLSCTDSKCAECPEDKCESCVSSYSLRSSSKRCERCTLSDCVECDELGSCLRCKAGMFYLDGKCQQCSVSNCDECVNNDIQKCQECKDGFFLSDSFMCDNCQVKSCSVCQTADTCEKCINGYYLGEEKNCKKCTLENCDDCEWSATGGKQGKGAEVCDDCKWGYEWNQKHNYCSKMVGEFQEPVWYWPILGLAVTIIGVAVVCYIYRQFLQRRATSNQPLRNSGERAQYTEFNEIR